MSDAGSEPLYLDEVKENLRIMTDDEDALLAALIVAARQHVENVTGLILTAREIVETARDFGAYGLDLRAWPVRSITSIGYVDVVGNGQTLASTGYVASLVQRPVRIVPAYASRWPALARRPAAVVVTMQAGFEGPEVVPQAIKQAMHLLIVHWYANRAAAEVGGRAAAIEIPMGVTALLNNYRSRSI